MKSVSSLVRIILAGAGTFLAGGPTWADTAAGIAIEHQELGCVVAGKFPRLNACFSPRSQVARARVYFRGESSPHWYYVEMTTDTPCFRGVLPRPGRAMHRFEYYVSVTDRRFGESRTSEYSPEVVADEGSCTKGPLAPFLSRASVAVGSASGAAFPPGFVGAGLGTATIIAGGVAVVGGGVIVGTIAGGDPASGPPSLPGSPATTTPSSPTVPSLPIQTTTTTLAGPSPTPTPGLPTTSTTLPTTSTTLPGPTTTTTTTTLPTPSTTLPGPTTTTTSTTLPGPTTTTTSTSTSTSTTSTTTTTSSTTSSTSTSTTSSTSSTSTTTLATCAGDLGPPTVSFLSPPNGLAVGPVNMSSSASDPDGFPVTVTYSLDTGEVLGSSTTPPYAVTWAPCGLLMNFTLQAQAVDRCGNASAIDTRNIVFVLPLPLCLAANGPRASGLVSELSAPSGRGQVIVNGKDAVFLGPGRAGVSVPLQRGQNRVEATLVSGGAGTWRFDLAGLSALGSLRVVAGEVALIGPDQVVFRMRGRSGERVVFSFEAIPPGR